MSFENVTSSVCVCALAEKTVTIIPALRATPAPTISRRMCTPRGGEKTVNGTADYRAAVPPVQELEWTFAAHESVGAGDYSGVTVNDMLQLIRGR
jgi:hypothetical protein